MNYCGFKKYDTANGAGIRVSLFVSGCRHHCKGCFQPETWDFSYGQPFDDAAQEKVLTALSRVEITGLSVLGGDPMEPENKAALLPFLRHVRTVCPGRDVWLYSGCRYEDIQDEPILDCVDVLVDGEFSFAERDLSLAFCGSRNQRIIDIKKSREAGTAVLWRDGL